MKNRREVLAALLEDYSMDATALLESLVAQMSDSDFYDGINYVQRVEDWRFKVDKDGNVYDTEEE